MVLLHSSLLYITLPWFYFTVYLTLLLCTMALLDASSLVRLARICIWVVRISFNGSNLHSNASNLVSNGLNSFGMVRICIRFPFSMVRICIQIVRIPFEWFELKFQFKSLSNGSNCSRMVQISFELFKFAFECFESLSNGSSLHLNG